MGHTREVRRAERRRGGPRFLREDMNRPHRRIVTPLVPRWKLAGSEQNSSEQNRTESSLMKWGRAV